MDKTLRTRGNNNQFASYHLYPVIFDILGFKWDEKLEKPKAESTALKLILKCIKFTAAAVLTLLLLSLCLYMATQNNPYLSRTVKNAMHDRNTAYSIARAMRFISMPFHKFIDMKRAQKWECLVRNPFYKAGNFYSISFHA